MGIENQSGDHPKPEVSQLEEYLKQIQPKPSESFYKKMKSAPWERKTNPIGLFFDRSHVYAWIIPAAMLIILGIAILYSPVGRATAREVWEYFRPESSAQISLPATLDTLIEMDELSIDFKLDLAEVEEMSGYDVATLHDLPDNILFNGAHYAPISGAVRLLYKKDADFLVFTQRSGEGAAEYASIGPDTLIEYVSVNGIPAEFVRGGWRNVALDPVGEATGMATATVSVLWDEMIPNITLRWQSGDHYYELLAIGDGWTPNQVIQLANSVK